MRLQPRHYLLIVVILGLSAWNLLRPRRTQPASLAVPVATAPTAPKPQSPAWNAFDHATELRDGSDADFQPALHALDAQPATADISGCRTWLVFYRQGKLHPAVDPQWQERSQRHLTSCVAEHRDTTS